MHQNGKICISEVTFEEIATSQDGELSELVYRKCFFCEKYFINSIYQLLSKDGYYCNFCLRHRHYGKKSKHILPLSFCSIIGFFYYQNYLQKNINVFCRKVCYSEIFDFIEDHICAGLDNPVFYYDEYSLIWFIDFTRVGEDVGQLPIEEINNTIDNIVYSFNIGEMVPGVNLHLFCDKYSRIIKDFYHNRVKPSEIFSPTFQDCGLDAYYDDFFYDNCREFNFQKMLMKRQKKA